eukprot:178030-Chlamydomonas_euryale.AAC.14
MVLCTGSSVGAVHVRTPPSDRPNYAPHRIIVQYVPACRCNAAYHSNVCRHVYSWHSLPLAGCVFLTNMVSPAEQSPNKLEAIIEGILHHSHDSS